MSMMSTFTEGKLYRQGSAFPIEINAKPAKGYIVPMPKPNRIVPRVRFFISEWIDSLDLTRRSVANAAGITESYLSLLANMHKGKHDKSPSANVIVAIAKAIKSEAHLKSFTIDQLLSPPPPKLSVDQLRGLPPDLIERLIRR